MYTFYFALLLKQSRRVLGFGVTCQPDGPDLRRREADAVFLEHHKRGDVALDASERVLV